MPGRYLQYQLIFQQRILHHCQNVSVCMKNKDVNHKNNSQFSDNYLPCCDGLILITCSIKKSFLIYWLLFTLTQKHLWERKQSPWWSVPTNEESKVHVQLLIVQTFNYLVSRFPVQLWIIPLLEPLTNLSFYKNKVLGLRILCCLIYLRARDGSDSQDRSNKIC